MQKFECNESGFNHLSEKEYQISDIKDYSKIIYFVI